jgi:hypothetical protein
MARRLPSTIPPSTGGGQPRYSLHHVGERDGVVAYAVYAAPGLADSEVERVAQERDYARRFERRRRWWLSGLVWLGSIRGDSKRRGAGPFAPTELRAYLPQRDLHRVTPTRSRSDVSRPQRVGMGLVRAERSGLTAGPSGGGNSPVEGSAALIPKTIHGHGNRIAAHPWAAPALPSRSRAASPIPDRPRVFGDAKSRAPHPHVIPAKAGIQSGAERSCFRRNDGGHDRASKHIRWRLR